MKILVVDDDEAIVALLSRFLAKQGFEVHTAMDAMQALDCLEREAIGAVLADLAMPHLDGRALVRRIREDPRTRELPVIIMSADPSDDVADKSLRAGASFFLPKPLNLDALSTLLHFAE